MARLNLIPRNVTGRVLRPGGLIMARRFDGVFDSGVIENGGFETDEFWQFEGTPWVHDPIKETAKIETATGGTDQLQYFPAPLEAGKTYQVSFDVLEWGGLGRIRVSGNGDSTDWFSALGTSTGVISVTGGSLGIQAQINWAGVIDNVRVVEV